MSVSAGNGFMDHVTVDLTAGLKQAENDRKVYLTTI